MALSTTVGIIALALWSLFWKAIALWKSARQNQWKWYLILIVINTIGLLEIIYLQWYQNKGKKLSHWKSWKDVSA